MTESKNPWDALGLPPEPPQAAVLEAIKAAAEPPVVFALEPSEVATGPKKRGPKPKPKIETEAEAKEPEAPAKILVETTHPYNLHCSTQDILIRYGTPTKIELDYWVQAQIDVGFLRIL